MVDNLALRWGPRGEPQRIKKSPHTSVFIQRHGSTTAAGIQGRRFGFRQDEGIPALAGEGESAMQPGWEHREAGLIYTIQPLLCWGSRRDATVPRARPGLTPHTHIAAYGSDWRLFWRCRNVIVRHGKMRGKRNIYWAPFSPLVSCFCQLLAELERSFSPQISLISSQRDFPSVFAFCVSPVEEMSQGLTSGNPNLLS